MNFEDFIKRNSHGTEEFAYRIYWAGSFFADKLTYTVLKADSEQEISKYFKYDIQSFTITKNPVTGKNEIIVALYSWTVNEKKESKENE